MAGKSHVRTRIASGDADRTRRFIFRQHNIGVFAQLTSILLVAALCEERDWRPFFVVRNKNLTGTPPEGNWLNSFFDQKLFPGGKPPPELLPRRPENTDVIRNRYDINTLAGGEPDAEFQNRMGDIRQAHRLFTTYLSIKTFVADLADRFVQDNLGSEGYLSVHYRGTDKIGGETDDVSHDAMFRAIDRFVGADRIFLATDCVDFFRACSSRYGDRVTYASRPTGASHLQDQTDNWKKSQGALLDCLILSKGRTLVKTPSLLSAWSKVFNPDQPVALVGRPFSRPWGEDRLEGFGYWPESRLYDPSAEARLRNRVVEMTT